MFRGEAVRETVSVIGTEAFIDFVEQIKVEGVELEYAQMGRRTRPKSPLVIEVDAENADKDIDALDIELPVLSPRIQRDYKNLEDLDVLSVPRQKAEYRQFSPEEQREIVFRDIDTEETSHITEMGSFYDPNYQSMIGYFTKKLMRDFRLVGNEAVLFGKLKEFIANDLFDVPVNLNDPNTLRNLSEDAAVRSLIETFKTAINNLTVRESGMTEIRDTIKLSKTRPFPVDPQKYVVARKSIFNKIVGDSTFELRVAEFLDGCEDIVSFAKNARRTGFTIEYRNAEGGISNYVPDFIVKQTANDIWVMETKGREGLDDPLKWARLKQWCDDASTHDPTRRYRPLFIREEEWDQYSPRNFEELTRTFAMEWEPVA